MRLVILFFALAALFLIPFLFLGNRIDEWLAGEGAVTWLKSFSGSAWIMAILLLLSDLILPVPATAVMAALGILYGPIVGGLIGGSGSVLSGMTAYSVCRLAGRKAALKLAGENDLLQGEKFFARSGTWAVVVSRWMPLLPEVIACLAGLTRMPAGRFSAALVCGSFPMAFVYAALGYAGVDHPVLALTASALIPLILWASLKPFLFRRDRA